MYSFRSLASAACYLWSRRQQVVPLLPSISIGSTDISELTATPPQ